jgi:CRP-like cAMP-binding protein
MAEPLPLETNEAVAALLSRALRLQPFFPEFTAEHARKLFPRSGLYAYARDHVLVRQGDPGHDLFIVSTGRLRVMKTKAEASSPVATLGSGAVIGEIALVREVPRTATVMALEDSEVYRLSYQDVRYLLDNNDELAAHLTALATERLIS